MKQLPKKAIIFLIVAIILISQSSTAVFAASYPDIECDAGFNLIFYTEGFLNIKFSVYPVFQNEIAHFNVYNPSGDLVFSTQEELFNVGSDYKKTVSVIIDTFDWDKYQFWPDGRYTLEYYMSFYSFYEWHDAPKKKTVYLNLITPCDEHTWDEGKILTAATLTRPGEILHTCQVCGFTSTDTIPATFTDIEKDSYYEAPVIWAYEKNITKGTTDSTFAPKEECTRGQIITFLYRACGSPNPTKSYDIADVSEADYYYNAVQWAKEQEMFDGNSFSPNSPCTRAMAIDFMWRYSGKPGAKKTSPFNDIDSASELASAVSWASESKITQGTSDTEFSPEIICNRAQIITFLYRGYSGEKEPVSVDTIQGVWQRRYIEKSDTKNGYTDVEAVSEYIFDENTFTTASYKYDPVEDEYIVFSYSSGTYTVSDGKLSFNNVGDTFIEYTPAYNYAKLRADDPFSGKVNIEFSDGGDLLYGSNQFEKVSESQIADFVKKSLDEIKASPLYTSNIHAKLTIPYIDDNNFFVKITIQNDSGSDVYVPSSVTVDGYTVYTGEAFSLPSGKAAEINFYRAEKATERYNIEYNDMHLDADSVVEADIIWKGKHYLVKFDSIEMFAME